MTALGAVVMTLLAISVISSTVFFIRRCVDNLNNTRKQRQQRGQLVRPSTGRRRRSRRWFLFVGDDDNGDSDTAPNERRPLLG